MDKSILVAAYENSVKHVPRELAEYFDNRYNEFFHIRECSSVKHSCCGSKYTKERVPLALFKNPYNNAYYKKCLDCRNYNKKIVRKHGESNEYGLFKCRTCGSLRTKDICEKCCKVSIESSKRQTIYHNQVIWEKIVKNGYCCERCKQSFKRNDDETPGFITLTGSLAQIGLTKENVEYRYLEWDHLTKEEQISHTGQYYGPKRAGVARIYAYESKKFESQKCMLLCLYCHRLRTAEQHGGLKSKVKQLVRVKIAYTDAKKHEHGECSICRRVVDASNLSFFEWDHIDSDTKRDVISSISRSGNAIYTMEYLIEELKVCRLVCLFCHRIRSSTQQTERYIAQRAPKLSILNAALEACKRTRPDNVDIEDNRPMKKI